MNLVIKDAELPKDNEMWVAVKPDGSATVFEFGKETRTTTASEMQDGKRGFRFDENGKKIWSTVVEDGEQTDNIDNELDAIVREAYNSVNQDYLREQAIIALVASGKNRDEVEEWLNQCEIGVTG